MSNNWEELDECIEREIETNRALNYLHRDIMLNIGTPIKKRGGKIAALLHLWGKALRWVREE